MNQTTLLSRTRGIPLGGPRLVIQIPCFNEEENLPQVLNELPRQINGIGSIEVQVIDDGSTDRTAEIARSYGVHHIICNRGNKGLARSFQTGIDHALSCGADIIVNTDGDNQYAGTSISDLVRPLLESQADIVIGDRNPGANREFSMLKRFLQRFGSRVVRGLAQVDVTDAVSGFRAYSREAALSINVMTTFSYTTETLIHAGQKGLKVVSVPIETNRVERPSRLFKSMSIFLRKQVTTILRSYVMYRSLNAFLALGLFLICVGLVPVIRFLVLYLMGDGDGRIQSLVLGSLFLVSGYVTVIIAFLSDTIATNRRLIETVLTRVREMEYGGSSDAKRSAD